MNFILASLFVAPSERRVHQSVGAAFPFSTSASAERHSWVAILWKTTSFGRRRMRCVPVESSCIDSVGYENEVLEVRFGNGGVYRYFEVPAQLYRQLLAAESKGRFFN